MRRAKHARSGTSESQRARRRLAEAKPPPPIAGLPQALAGLRGPTRHDPSLLLSAGAKTPDNAAQNPSRQATSELIALKDSFAVCSGTSESRKPDRVP